MQQAAVVTIPVIRLAIALSAATLFMNVHGLEKLECNSTSIAYTITVSNSGRGDFIKVQDAIDSIPLKNVQWTRIFVMPGVYEERVEIHREKPCIVIEGRSHRITTITNNYNTTTFRASADNFVAKRITFQNTYKGGPAQALAVEGDKCLFRFCGFVGFQDTLWDIMGRHYFYSCYIEGSIDFIYGQGQSVYEKAVIRTTNSTFPGYITAQGRNSPDDPSGFVFIGCYVSGNGSTYLGRAYGSYSRVVFRKTYFDDVIQPLGWDSWFYGGQHLNDITYVEVGCFGPGANTSNRVHWMKNLTKAEVKGYKVSTFIDQEGWITKQPL
ncbi:hypothetical protein Dimus_012126 [Dionaea muscipula]